MKRMLGGDAVAADADNDFSSFSRPHAIGTRVILFNLPLDMHQFANAEATVIGHLPLIEGRSIKVICSLQFIYHFCVSKRYVISR